MSGMNEFLAQAYGTAEPQQTADAEKVAQAELFAKLAAENGIDLNTLDDNQITELWNATFAKTAGEEEKKEHGHKHHGEKEAEARALAEWTQTKEAQAKSNEADYFGRQMAHAYVAELRKIASEGGFNFLEGSEGETKEAKGMPPQLAKALGRAGKAVEHVGKKVTEKATGVGTHGMKPSHAKAVGGAAIGGAAAATGGAAAAAHHVLKDKKKKASALTETAAPLAIEKAAAAGFDRDEAVERISAVLTLGFNEDNTKVAAVTEFPQAKEIRALELLEAAGYPVTWEQPQG